MTVPDLWERLARLDQCCDLVARSRPVSGGVNWTVRITPRDRRGDPITAEGATLVEALSDALARAEALRWMPPG